jgi:hypothetical protein
MQHLVNAVAEMMEGKATALTKKYVEEGMPRRTDGRSGMQLCNCRCLRFRGGGWNQYMQSMDEPRKRAANHVIHRKEGMT